MWTNSIKTLALLWVLTCLPWPLSLRIILQWVINIEPEHIILLPRTWIPVQNSSVSGLCLKRDCERWAGQAGTGRQGQSLTLSLGQASQSYFVSNRLDTRSVRAPSVLTHKIAVRRSGSYLINETYGPPGDSQLLTTVKTLTLWSFDWEIRADPDLIFISGTVTVREIRNLICTVFKWQKLRPFRTNLAIIFRHLDNKHQ